MIQKTLASRLGFFVAFKDLFEVANGPESFAAMLAIPEPAAIVSIL